MTDLDTITNVTLYIQLFDNPKSAQKFELFNKSNHQTNYFIFLGLIVLTMRAIYDAEIDKTKVIP